MADTTKNRPKWLTDLIGTALYGYNGIDRATYDREQETGLSGLELAQHDYALRNGGSIMYGTPNQGGGSEIYGTPSSPALADDIRDRQGGFTVKSTQNKSAQETKPLVDDEQQNNLGDQGGGSGKGSMPTTNGTTVETPVAEAAPQYQGTWQDQIAQMLDEIMGIGEFKYDFAVDPLYQQHAERYNRNGRLAMMDTMANAAALTGGYGNTYAQQVGQQAYNGYMQDLNAVLPDLYELAYSQYMARGNQLRDNLAILQGMDDVEYNRFMDKLAFDYQKAQDDREFYAKYPHLAPGYVAPKPNPGGGGGAPNNNDEEPSTDEAMEDHIIEVATEYAAKHPTYAYDAPAVEKYIEEFVQQNGYGLEGAELFTSILEANGLKHSGRGR